jgi:hypothetical protein
MKALWAVFCAVACLGFFGGFIYLCYGAHECIVGDREVARVLNDPSFTNYDWAAYLMPFDQREEGDPHWTCADKIENPANQ